MLWGAGDWSLVSLDYLENLLSALRSKFHFRPDCEFTLECNPANLSSQSLLTFKQIGVNRLSLSHYSYPKLKQIVSDLGRLGLVNFNFDLYFGQPGQTLSAWQKELERMLLLRPPHLSLYSFDSKKTNQRLKQKIYYHSLDFLSQNRYKQYEICHFCRPGFKSKQNSIYWNRKHFAGFGLGSSSFWKNIRSKNTFGLGEYLRLIKKYGSAVIQRQKINPEQEQSEELYYALRQTRGLDLNGFRQKYGEHFYNKRKNLIDRLIEKGYLFRRQNRLALTKEGFLIADDLIAKLV